MADITNTEDIIDVRDVIERFEELETERDEFEPEGVQDERWASNYPEDAEELERLTDLLSDLEGNGGDEEWRNAWYPVTLIRDSYFEDYARQLAEDIGAIDRKAGWPFGYIDWKAAAEALQIDYTAVDYDGETYWYR